MTSVLRMPLPPSVGRLMTAKEVATEILGGHRPARWVRENLRAGRVRLGHNTVLWEEYTVKRYLLDQAEGDE